MIGVLGKFSRDPQKTKELLKLLTANHSLMLGDCRVPANAPIFASRKYFFSQLTLRICREYTPYENVDLYLKNEGENSKKNSDSGNIG